MKTIGLIGGMSWESTVSYYQILNRVTAERMGGLHSARCLLYSVDFAEIEACQSSGEWERSADILAGAAVCLERAGAELLVICTNTMHKVAGAVQSAVKIPLLHIADVTVDELRRGGVERAALLGTRYTMEQDFYRARLEAGGIQVMTPSDEGRALVDRIIFDELCLGHIYEKSRQQILHIIRQLAEEGAQGIVLGCTELGLLVHQGDGTVPVFDTTVLHATRAALAALEV